MENPDKQQVRIRIPKDLKCWVIQQATANRRTQNAEITLLIEQGKKYRELFETKEK